MEQKYQQAIQSVRLRHMLLILPTAFRFYSKYRTGYKCFVYKQDVNKKSSNSVLQQTIIHNSEEGRISSVGIQTGYGLDGQGFESRIFYNLPNRPWGSPTLLYNGYWVFPGGKSAGRSFDHPTPFSSEVKETVELNLYSPSGPSWPVLG